MKHTIPVHALLLALLSAAVLCAPQSAPAYYDPGAQRWLNRDPLAERGGINLFQAVGNNPIVWFDRFGLAVAPTQYLPAGPGDNTVICYNGNLTIQNKNQGPDRRCTGEHEYRHLQDWISRYGEDVCKGQRNGTTPVGGDGYTDFLRQSECRAFKAGKKCRENLLKKCLSQADRDAIQKGIERDDQWLQKFKCD